MVTGLTLPEPNPISPQSRPQSGFVAPSAPGPELQQQSDLGGLVAQVTNDLAAVFSERIERNRRARDERVAALGGDADTFEAIAEEARKLRESGLEDKEARARAFENVAAKAGIVRTSDLIKLRQQVGRAAALRGIAQVEARIPEYASDPADAYRRFEAALTRVEAEGLPEAVRGNALTRDAFRATVNARSLDLRRQLSLRVTQEARGQSLQAAISEAANGSPDHGTRGLSAFIGATVEAKPEIRAEVFSNMVRLEEENQNPLEVGVAGLELAVEEAETAEGAERLLTEFLRTPLRRDGFTFEDPNGSGLRGPADLRMRLAALEDRIEAKKETEVDLETRRHDNSARSLRLRLTDAAAGAAVRAFETGGDVNRAVEEATEQALSVEEVGLLRANLTSQEVEGIAADAKTRALESVAQRSGVREAAQAAREQSVSLLIERGQVEAARDEIATFPPDRREYFESLLKGDEFIRRALPQVDTYRALEKNLTSALDLASQLGSLDEGEELAAEVRQEIEGLARPFASLEDAQTAIETKVAELRPRVREFRDRLRAKAAEGSAVERDVRVALSQGDLGKAKSLLLSRGALLAPDSEANLQNRITDTERQIADVRSGALKGAEAFANATLRGTTFFKENPDREAELLTSVISKTHLALDEAIQTRLSQGQQPFDILRNSRALEIEAARSAVQEITGETDFEITAEIAEARGRERIEQAVQRARVFSGTGELALEVSQNLATRYRKQAKTDMSADLRALLQDLSRVQQGEGDADDIREGAAPFILIGTAAERETAMRALFASGAVSVEDLKKNRVRLSIPLDVGFLLTQGDLERAQDKINRIMDAAGREHVELQMRNQRIVVLEKPGGLKDAEITRGLRTLNLTFSEPIPEDLVIGPEIAITGKPEDLRGRPFMRFRRLRGLEKGEDGRQALLEAVQLSRSFQ